MQRFICWWVRSRTRAGSRAVFCESMDQPHLIAAVHQVLVQSGRHPEGVAGGSDGHRHQPEHRPKVQASFAPVAKHYGVTCGAVSAAAPEPQRRGRER